MFHVFATPAKRFFFFFRPAIFFYILMFYASTVNVFTWFHKRAFTATTSEVLRLDLFCMPPTGNVAEVISGILFSRCPSKYPIRFSRNTLHMLHPIEHLLAYCTSKHSRADPRDPLSVSRISGIPKKWSDTDTRRRLRSNNENDVSHVHCPSGASFLSHNSFRTAVWCFFV